MLGILRYVLGLTHTAIKFATIEDGRVMLDARPWKSCELRYPVCGRKCEHYDTSSAARLWRAMEVVSLRDVICRELIANTLIHREHTSPFPAKMVIDVGGIRTENASRPRFIGPLTPDRFNPLPKNPIIAELFANIGRADALGSGTRNLFKYSWAYGGAQPVLTEGDVFEASVPILRGPHRPWALPSTWTRSSSG